MRKKAKELAVAAIMISITAIFYIIQQPNTYHVEDILEAYVEHGDYNDIAIEYPLDETLFPPEMVLPVYRWKDSNPASRSWLLHFEFSDGKPCMNFIAK